MTIRVGLESYEVLARHGVYDFEHENEQRFVISIWVEVIDDRTSDSISDTVNYADLQEIIDSEVVHSSPVRLMETLCKNMTNRLSDNKLISKISIRIEKPDAPLPHPGGLPIVEYEWARV